MSVRAELVRLGLRWLMKPGNAPGVTIPRRRERIANFQRWVPAPPAEVLEEDSQLGGVPTLRVATPAWHALLAEGADSRLTAVVGDSAGGGLALALALKLRDGGAPLPAAIVG